MTLIELLAGMAILGLLISGTLVARGRFQHQNALAQRRLEAVSAANALISDWWADADGVPHHGEGTVTRSDLQWRMSEHKVDSLSLDDVVMVRLEVVDPQIAPGGPPLTTVELILPRRQESERPVIRSGS